MQYRIQKKNDNEYRPQYKAENGKWKPLLWKEGEHFGKPVVCNNRSAAYHYMWWENAEVSNSVKDASEVPVVNSHGRTIFVPGSKEENDDKPLFDRELFVCDCQDIEHQFVVEYMDDPEWNRVCIEVKLNRNLPFWRRLVVAFKYLFKRRPSRFGDFDEIILQQSDAERLQKVVDAVFYLKKEEEKKITGEA